MSLPPLRVAFLWHMHQPLYKDPQSGVYRLPWVRLHALKDYYDMVARLDDFPDLRANFNLVPVLVEQILDYAGGGVIDSHLELSRKPVEKLTAGEKVSFLRNSFLGNKATLVERHPRYRALLHKCGPLASEHEAKAALKRFTAQDLLDLQVWSNLAWFDPIFEKEPLVADLLARGRNFTEQMKADLIDLQFRIMKMIVPKYRELLEAGRIEITFSPYYHPILPLLVDSESAREAVPDISLPARRIEFGTDARRQIELGKAYHKEIFGVEPAGMWPPEGALCEDCLRVACECGVRWVAADETMLASALGVDLGKKGIKHVYGRKKGAGHASAGREETGHTLKPEDLYRPHRFVCDGIEAVLLFRDRLLSDLISFSYNRLQPRGAVEDFMKRLLAIRDALGAKAADALVLVALDGENCWEFYDRDGDMFLRTLYSRLAGAGEVRTVRISEALDEMKSLPEIKRVSPGSWIGGNLATWIGNAHDNRAWDLLYDARENLIESEREGGLDGGKREQAWRSVYAAEGSDWFWWWGTESGCREEDEFDALFRTHLMEVYTAAGKKVPAEVLEPVGQACAPDQAISLEPAAFMKPVLDGMVTNFYEWKLAGLYESYKDGLVQGKQGVISAIYFGFDQHHLFLRIDSEISPQQPEFVELTFRLEFISPRRASVSFRAPGPRSCEDRQLNVVAGDPIGEARAAAFNIVEIAVPFESIAAPPDSVLSLRVAVIRGEQELERRPARRSISITVPGADFESRMWSTL